MTIKSKLRYFTDQIRKHRDKVPDLDPTIWNSDSSAEQKQTKPEYVSVVRKNYPDNRQNHSRYNKQSYSNYRHDERRNPPSRYLCNFHRRQGYDYCWCNPNRQYHRYDNSYQSRNAPNQTYHQDKNRSGNQKNFQQNLKELTDT